MQGGGGGGLDALMWLLDTLKLQYGLKKSLLEPGSLGLLLRRGAQGVKWECVPKHARTLFREFGMR